MRRVTTLVLSILLLAACDGSIGGIEDPDRPMPVPCAPPLAGMPGSITVAPRGIAVVRVEGGTSHPRFALAMGGTTGSRIEETTGVLVAGDTAGEEEVTVTDLGCIGEATVVVTVSDALAVEPATSDVAPSTEIQFVVRGGAGPFTFSLVRAGSGGTIDALGAYRAGTTEGDDLVRVVDDVTGATADGSIRVRTGAGLALEVPRVGVPVGSRHVPAVSGGSGYVDLSSSSASFTIEGDAIIASSPGDATITLTDHYTATSVTLAASALATRTAPSTRVGDRSELNTVLSGDFDEDGEADVLVAMPGSNVAHSRGGAVFLYRGGASGFSDVPERTITGVARDDNFGSAATLGDLDHDGHLDLIVGAWQDDSLGANVGAVFVYRGVPGELFEATPYLSLYGVSGSDRFGVSLAAGDFDGDGFTDLAVGAADDEDNPRVPRRDQQGAVHVFQSYAGRILGRADQILFGDMPDGAGGLTSHNDMRFGSALAAGDFDGDGLTDLAIQAQRPDAMTSNDGSVSLHRGVGPVAGATHGGLSELASIVWAATADGDRSGRFGAFLSMGDVDGDGLDDLLASHHVHDRAAMGSTAAVNDLGAAHLFRGRALGTTTASATTPVAMADWSHEGLMGSAFFGHGVQIADATGDGLADLVIAESRVTPMGSDRSRPGQIHVFTGVRGGLPSATPSRSIDGPHDDERFGNGLAVAADAIFAVAPFADDGGLDTGRFYVVTASAVDELSIPGRASGRRLGQTVAFAGDLTGDGVGDLVVGAPHQPDPSGMMRGIDFGAAYVYAGDGTGFETTVSTTLAGYTLASNASHSESDWLGEIVASAGDFDGDGRDDVAVVARFEDLPAAFDDTLWTLDGDCGAAARSDAGAVFVWSGVASGGTLSPSPSFVYFAPVAGRTIQMLAGDVDVNGDGLADLIVGGANWLSTGAMPERRGGYAIVLGRARAAGGLGTVICAASTTIEGAVLNDELGASAARIGDLDMDGCDEVAIGAPRLDRTGVTDEGGVHVLFGFGVGCTGLTPTTLVLRPTDRTMLAGSSVSGGVDLDGGGRPDLVVGAPRFATTLGEVGRVYVLSGERILAQRLGADVTFASVAIAGTWFVNGGGAGERLGTSVAVLPDAGPSNADLVAAGGLYANLGGTPNSGGARIFPVVRTTGIGAAFALIAGETTGAYPELGASLAATGTGASARLAIGASWGSGELAQEGSAYVFDP